MPNLFGYSIFGSRDEMKLILGKPTNRDNILKLQRSGESTADYTNNPCVFRRQKKH